MADMTQGLAGMGDLAAKLQSGAAGSDPTALGLGSLLGNMSMTVICVNILAGLIGSAYFMYGKKNCNIKVVCWGVALCVVPYFIGNTILLIVACVAMAAAPFVV
ncbi:MAG: hypothetical protein M0T70_07635 [Geobacteraceae bacterium]|nr:hypothetical protein [Geobacteraceae bacterium]